MSIKTQTHIGISHQNEKKWGFTLIVLWTLWCLVAIGIAIHSVWLPYMTAKDYGFQNIKSDPFDGTVLPITHIPNWLKETNRDKTLHFHNIPTSELVPIPRYNPQELLNQNNTLMRFTYTVPYMGSYTFNYKEYDGSHLGVDIRAPIGTPVLAIANGVVTQAVSPENPKDNKYVVIRHDNVPLNGTTTTLYSGYLHLSEVNVVAGQKIAKWEMLGRVGSTGISTTPHLHFQIDKESAPFHPYWPFNQAESRKLGLNIYQGVTAGLWQEKALEYTIHPMDFVYHYIAGTTNHLSFTQPKVTTPKKSLEEIVNFTTTEQPEVRLENIVSYSEENNIVVASQIFYNHEKCDDIKTPNNTFGKNLEKLHKISCIFSHISNVDENAKVSRRDALIAIMKFYQESPQTGVSHFLDIPLYDEEFQWYAITAYQKGIFTSSYIRGDDGLTRGEFIEILGRFGRLKTATAKSTNYSDVNANSSLAKNIKNYKFSTGDTAKKIFPHSSLTQKDLIEILSKL